MYDRSIYAKVSEEVHAWLLALANINGCSVGDVVSQILTDAYSHAVATGKYEPSDVVLKYYTQLNFARRRREMVLEMARMHQANPSEASAEMLRAACEAAGLSLDEIMQAVKTEPVFMSLVSAESTKMMRCIRWLRELFLQHQEIPASQIMDLAAKAGYSAWMVNQAKAKLGLRSSRRTSGWVWERTPEFEQFIWQDPDPIGSGS